jgi:hypothetical protein
MTNPSECVCGPNSVCSICDAATRKERRRAIVEELKRSTLRRGRAAKMVSESRDEARRTGRLPRVTEASGVHLLVDLSLVKAR